MIETWSVDLFTRMIEQAPTIAALIYLVWRQERTIARCYDKILEMFGDNTNK